MLAPMAAIVTAVVGYLLGSIPVAGMVGRHAGRDLRESGDRNPGFWNARAQLSRRAATAVFVGDVTKAAVAAGIGRVLGEQWLVGYVGAAAAMVGHAWPVFASFRGGRSVLCFVGAMIVLAPIPAAIAIAACVLVSLGTRSFAYRARVGVFGFPIVQALFEPRAHVAATGLLMTIIGLRFVMASMAPVRGQRAEG
jgi:glycerol-3-phosphate acyltransferase PlsY